jgi:sarcosine oxidase subunit alpha
VVIGAGPAGIAAAAELAQRGLDVLLVERDGRIGGSGRYRGLDIQTLPESVRALTSSTCVGLYPDEEVVGLVTPHGPAEVRFERLVIATGAYDRPLAYEGNDLPGTIGVRAFERLAWQGAFTSRMQLGLFAAPVEADRAAVAASRHGLRFAWAAGPVELSPSIAGEVLVDRLARARGHRRVGAVDLEHAGTRTADVLVLGFTQPTYELSIHAGAAAAVAGSPAVVVAGATPNALVLGEAAGWNLDPAGEVADVVARWLETRAVSAPAQPPVFPEAAVPAADAFVCFCEDVRVRDIEAAVDDGYLGAELVKRRTGAGTGPCQGAYCLGEIAATLQSLSLEAVVPTVRPPMYPVSLVELAVAHD